MSKTIDLEAQIDQLRRAKRARLQEEQQSSAEAAAPVLPTEPESGQPSASPVSPVPLAEISPVEASPKALSREPLDFDFEFERKPLLRGLLVLACVGAVCGGWSLAKVHARAKPHYARAHAAIPLSEPLPWQSHSSKPSAAQAMDPQIEKLKSGLASAEERMQQMEKQLVEERSKQQPVITQDHASKDAEVVLNEQVKQWQASYAKLEAALAQQQTQVEQLQYELTKARYEQVQKLLAENETTVAAAKAVLKQREALAALNLRPVANPEHRVPVSVLRRPSPSSEPSHAGRVSSPANESPVSLFRAAQF